MDRPYIIADQHGRIRYMDPGKLRSREYAKVMVSYYNIPCQGCAEEIIYSLYDEWILGKEIISRIVPLKESKDIKKLRKMREKREGVVQVFNTVEPPVPCKDKKCRICLEEHPKILGRRLFIGYPTSNPSLGRYFLSPAGLDYEKVIPEEGGPDVLVAEEPSSKHVGKLSLRGFFPEEIGREKCGDFLGALIYDLNMYIKGDRG